MHRSAAVVGMLVVVGTAQAADPAAVERGRKALLETAYIPAFWPAAAADDAWRAWGLKQKPADYADRLRERYGLHPAPYPNGGLPMGLRAAPFALFAKGVGIDCLLCHGGSINGQSYVGLGNSTLDVHTLFEEMSAASGNPTKLKFAHSQVRGTSEAGAFAVFLLGLRNDDLTLRDGPSRDLDLHDDSVEDVPAWWLLKKKRTMYHVGATDARSVRSIMQFMMHPLVPPRDFERAEPAFRDIQQYILSLEPPKYPWPIDRPLAAKGEAVFNGTCAKCHGTYGERPTYPNRVIALDEIDTDRKRHENINERFGEAYNASWFGKEPGVPPIRPTAGYQAPPLDGVWATAPYFHNGSVPTLDGVLNSAARPRVFTRSYRTGEADYDKDRVGWKVTEVSPPAPTAPGVERRKVYDTTQPGRGNGGHTYGDALTPADRRAVVEYLKTL
jgi:mono/diheme cytochrome c family protein